jgi:hypothetical protein
MLKEYTMIQKTRLACRIEESGKLEEVKKGLYKYTNKVGAVTELLEFSVDIKIVPKPGDYIVRISKESMYHVSKEEFESTYRSTGFKLI